MCNRLQSTSPKKYIPDRKDDLVNMGGCDVRAKKCARFVPSPSKPGEIVLAAFRHWRVYLVADRAAIAMQIPPL